MNSSKHVNVYIADVMALNDPQRYEAALQLVDRGRRSRIERFRYMDDKLLSLGAGLLLARAFEREGIKDTQTVLTPEGKPYLKNNRDIFFSLSHSGSAVMCSIADVPVGCDIQKLKEHAPLNVARRAFSSEEQAGLEALDSGQQRLYFYKLWTGKESYLKLTGEGLKSMPDDFTIRLPFGCQTVRDRLVTFMDIPWEDDYQATVCAEGVVNEEQLAINSIEL